MVRAGPLRLFEFAPRGVCLASCVTAVSGVLLPHLFTLTLRGGRFVSVALSIARVYPALTHHYNASLCSVESGLSS